MKENLDRQFFQTRELYFEKFGENYPLCITDMSPLKEHILKMEEAIQTGKKVKINYDDNVIY